MSPLHSEPFHGAITHTVHINAAISAIAQFIHINID